MRDPGEVLTTFLTVFVERLKLTPGLNLPRRQLIIAGEPAWDCESLIVAAASTYQGLPGQQRPGFQAATAGFAMHSMDVEVLLMRPIRIGMGQQLPSAVDLNKDTLRATADGKALSDAYYAGKSELAGFCDNLYYGGVSWIGPQGGFLATELSLGVQL